MLKVGITGGIGSGKTTVCRVFEFIGVPVYYSDKKAKELMQTDSELREQLKSAFGVQLYDKNQHLVSKYLSGIVFKQPGELEKLNAMVHPVVIRDYFRWCEENQNNIYTILESALIFETGLNKKLDYVITIHSTLDMRIKRIMDRDGTTREKVLERMKNQMEDIKKIKKSDYVIIDDERATVIEQVLSLHNLLSA